MKTNMCRSNTKGDKLKWWYTYNEKVSRKKTTSYKKHRHWIYRRDVWPFAFIVYPTLFAYSLHCTEFRWRQESITAAFLDNATLFDRVLLYLCGIVAILSHILCHLATYWSASWKIFIEFKPTTPEASSTATHILVESPHREIPPCLCDVIVHDEHAKVRHSRIHYFKKCYTLDEDQRLHPLHFPSQLPLSFYTQIAKSKTGFTSQDVLDLHRIYGVNNFDIVLPTFMELFRQHIIAPFFVFQVFCVGLWLLDEYWSHSLMTLALLVFLEAQLVMKRLSELVQLREMRLKPNPVYVWREARWQVILSDSLLPGDIMAMPCPTKAHTHEMNSEKSRDNEELMCPCDALLLSGTVMMNESTLTGESVPQCKVPLQVTQENETTLLNVKSAHRQHILCAGTTFVVMEAATNASPRVTSLALPANAKFCCVVLKTGFETTQGKIVRTILYASDRVTGENKEAVLFLLVLTLCSLVASGYVLWYSWADVFSAQPPTRSLYKLILNCVMIVTSVVPPEFPITMSMAVTLSLIDLCKKKIFCTEPLRLPYAGRVTVCAFDKTGTLTTDKMEVHGVIGSPTTMDDDLKKAIHEKNTNTLLTPSTGYTVPFRTSAVLSACHSLAFLDGQGLVGDPVEQAALEFTGAWKLANTHHVAHDHPVFPNTMRIIRRFPFSSELRRMCVVVEHVGVPFKKHVMPSGVMAHHSSWHSSQTQVKVDCETPSLQRDDTDFSQSGGFYVLCKGSPDTIRSFLVSVPEYYDALLQLLYRSGFRVLALAFKNVTSVVQAASVSPSSLILSTSRDILESSLLFSGFLVLSCRLKPATVSSLTKLLTSGYKVIMITGDNVLTASQVALDAKMIPSHFLSWDPFRLLSSVSVDSKNTVTLHWTCRDQLDHTETTDQNALGLLKEKFVLSIEGPMLEKLQTLVPLPVAFQVIEATTIFARMDPRQKELIMSVLKSQDQVILMCGDGTNDVGALKTAHIGISLLSGDEDVGKKTRNLRSDAMTPLAVKESSKKHRDNAGEKKNTSLTHTQTRGSAPLSLQDRLKAYEAEQAMDLPLPTLGMASCASPFTHKGTTIRCVPTMLRYGKATLATVMMSYKIMAINALITAFSLSVLTLDGVKLGDFQTTAENFFVSFLVFVSSKAKPARQLSPKERHTGLFSPKVLMSIFGQSAIHLACLLVGWRMSFSLRPVDYDKDVDGQFAPNLTNTMVFLILAATHGSTFLANYSGRPNLVPLREHPTLRQGLIFFFFFIMLLTMEIIPSLNELFSLVQFPSFHLKLVLLGLIALDVLGSCGIAFLLA